jgi:hypothetical protein
MPADMDLGGLACWQGLVAYAGYSYFAGEAILLKNRRRTFRPTV